MADDPSDGCIECCDIPPGDITDDMSVFGVELLLPEHEFDPIVDAVEDGHRLFDEDGI